MARVVLCHGAWSSVWAWARMRPLMAAAGHEFWTPSYTGLGARLHLAGPAVDLETHINDVLGVIRTEELSGVTLLAHSYGGLVGTGVADRARDVVERVIYLDAFVPGDNESLMDLVPAAHREAMEAGAAAQGEGWRVPSNPPSPDTSEADLAWVNRHRNEMPIECFRQRLRLSRDLECPRHYIYAKRCNPGDPFRPFYARAMAQAGWSAEEMDVSHSPNVTAPELLMQALARVL